MTIPLAQATESQCRWIEGEDTLCCGDETYRHSSWCEPHYKRAFLPPDHKGKRLTFVPQMSKLKT